MAAIRIRGLCKYFGPQVEIDGAERPGEAWRTLLRIAGFNVRATAEAEVQRTVAVAGHVLRDISLDIEHGSVVCLTGASGSGKSVLLRILAGIVPPTAGSVQIYEPVSSLLAVGDNLDGNCTAHENIQNSATFQTASPEDAARYAAEVIEFGELQGFEHVPIRTYSTGMILRLSVGLALCGRPSIVLIDDVLAVGDIAFQQKCVERVHALKQAGCTLVVAFSDDALVQQLATRVITLGAGRIVNDAPPRHWTAAPYRSRAAGVEWRTAENLPEDDVVALRGISLEDQREGDETYLDLALQMETKAPKLRCWPFIILTRARTVLYRSLHPGFLDVDDERRLMFTVRIPTHILPDGEYAITIGMATLQGRSIHSMKAPDAVALTIRRDSGDGGEATALPLLAMTMPWEIETLARHGAR